MTARMFVVPAVCLIAFLVRSGVASATETFDCSINNHQWELMAHYGSHGEVSDVILFISDTEKYSYFVGKDEVALNNKEHQFSLKIASRGPDTPDLEIQVSDAGGSVIFRGKNYDIQCTWNDE